MTAELKQDYESVAGINMQEFLHDGCIRYALLHTIQTHARHMFVISLVFLSFNN